jgi:hypothetical protein
MARTSTAVTLSFNKALTALLDGAPKVRFDVRDGAVRFRPKSSWHEDNVVLTTLTRKNKSTVSTTLRAGKIAALAGGFETTPLIPGVVYTVEQTGYSWFRLVPVTPDTAHRPERVTVSRKG